MPLIQSFINRNHALICILHTNQFERLPSHLAMRLTKFLFIIEKITIIIVVLTFIPIALFVFKAKNVQVPDSLEKAYSTVLGQLEVGGFLTSPSNSSVCQSPPPLFYQLCFERCKMGNDCMITNSSSLCPFRQSYKLGNYQFCSDKPIKNQIFSNFSTSCLDKTFTPLSHINTNSNSSVLEYYCLNSTQACSNAYSVFGQSIRQTFTANYASFWIASTLMMYFGLIPLVAHIVLVVVIDFIKRFNLRLTNSLLVIHQALVGIGCTIAVFEYNQNNQDFEQQLKFLSTQCIIKDGSYCQKTLSNEFALFDANDGIASAFVQAMLWITVLQIFCLIGIFIINVLIMKYYALRETHPENEGYELQML